jgi:mono/diheme cytochrome c family protein
VKVAPAFESVARGATFDNMTPVKPKSRPTSIMNARSARVFLLLPLLATFGCKQNPERSDEFARPPEQIGAPAMANDSVDGGSGEAAKTYYSRCSTCHGLAGRGDGPALRAFKLKHKPRDYTDLAWQRSVKDEEIRKTILGGGTAAGKSPDMPAFSDFKGKDAELDALVAYIRAFAKR